MTDGERLATNHKGTLEDHCELLTYRSHLHTHRFDSSLHLDLAVPEPAPLYRSSRTGVRVLYQRGFMHRDVKPVNMAICGIDPLKAVILDLDSAIDEMEA